jgi:hypothetical protein
VAGCQTSSDRPSATVEPLSRQVRPFDEGGVVQWHKASVLPRPTGTTGSPLCTARSISRWRAFETLLPYGVSPSTTKPASGEVFSIRAIKATRSTSASGSNGRHRFRGSQPGPDIQFRSSPSSRRDAAKWVFRLQPRGSLPGPQGEGDRGFESACSSGESAANLSRHTSRRIGPSSHS